MKEEEGQQAQPLVSHCGWLKVRAYTNFKAQQRSVSSAVVTTQSTWPRTRWLPAICVCAGQRAAAAHRARPGLKLVGGAGCGTARGARTA